MFKSIENVKGFIEKNQISAVDLKYCDLWGGLHHITLPGSQSTNELMAKGIGFDGSSVGLKNVKAGDMILKPDLKTGFLDPFWERLTLSFLSIIYNADTQEIFTNDPRTLSRNGNPGQVSSSRSRLFLPDGDRAPNDGIGPGW